MNKIYKKQKTVFLYQFLKIKLFFLCKKNGAHAVKIPPRGVDIAICRVSSSREGGRRLCIRKRPSVLPRGEMIYDVINCDKPTSPSRVSPITYSDIQASGRGQVLPAYCLIVMPSLCSIAPRIFFAALSVSSTVSVWSGERKETEKETLFLPSPSCAPR